MFPYFPAHVFSWRLLGEIAGWLFASKQGFRRPEKARLMTTNLGKFGHLEAQKVELLVAVGEVSIMVMAMFM